MINAVSQLDKQLQHAAQPLSDSDSAVVLGSLGQDPFGGSAWRRLTGNYPNDAATATRSPICASGWRRCRSSSSRPVEQVVELLEKKAAALSRLRGYIQRRGLLEVWLFVHVPLTFVLIAALFAHIISVFFYW